LQDCIHIYVEQDAEFLRFFPISAAIKFHSHQSIRFKKANSERSTDINII
jgi:hypothetical protein